MLPHVPNSIRQVAEEMGRAEARPSEPAADYKLVPVCEAGRGRLLRSISAALTAALSAGVIGAGLFLAAAACNSAFEGGFGGVLWVWDPVRTIWLFTNL